MRGIHWFPGHMQKTRREIAEHLRAVDVIVEVIDARVPSTSRNPDLAPLAAGKPRIVVLTKADLADPTATRRWIRHFGELGLPAVSVDAATGRGVDEVRQAIRKAFAPTLAALRQRGRLPRPARAMVMGMPNVGKSSLINRLCGDARVRTGAKPGVTRGRQWIRAGRDIELLDLPGVLVPKFVDQSAGYRLAALGCVKEEVYDAEEVVGVVLDELWRHLSDALRDRWGLMAITADHEANLRHLAQGRGFLRGGGEADTGRAAAVLLREVRTGKLGPLTLDPVPEFRSEC